MGKPVLRSHRCSDPWGPSQMLPPAPGTLCPMFYQLPPLIPHVRALNTSPQKIPLSSWVVRTAPLVSNHSSNFWNHQCHVLGACPSYQTIQHRTLFLAHSGHSVPVTWTRDRENKLTHVCQLPPRKPAHPASMRPSLGYSIITITSRQESTSSWKKTSSFPLEN